MCCKSTIVVLEDQDMIAELMCEVLEKDGYGFAHAQTADEVLAHCRNHGGTVKALIADLELPSCRGSDVALAVSHAYPSIKTLFVTGTPIGAWSERDLGVVAQLQTGSFAFLSKPFVPSVLLRSLNEFLNSRAEAHA
jgi:DNA-binding NtrC family response regulator